MSDTDLKLLLRYIRHGAEDAFAEIVRRHVTVVHSAALRQVRAFQHKEFFALCPSENSWQIDAMNAKRKFQVFVILLLASGILVRAMEFA